MINLPTPCLALGNLLPWATQKNNDHTEVKSLASMAFAATIVKLALFHDLHNGSIQVACDRESTLHCCFKQLTSNPLTKHFYLIQVTHTMLQDTPISWSWVHICGHQDDLGQLLTVMEQCNVEMDTAVK